MLENSRIFNALTSARFSRFYTITARGYVIVHCSFYIVHSNAEPFTARLRFPLRYASSSLPRRGLQSRLHRFSAQRLPPTAQAALPTCGVAFQLGPTCVPRSLYYRVFGEAGSYSCVFSGVNKQTRKHLQDASPFSKTLPSGFRRK